MRKFTQYQLPALEFKTAVKKPLPVQCAQIPEPFEVETMEGVMKGKAGDWLMVGIKGELYVCEDAIFKKSYQLE